MANFDKSEVCFFVSAKPFEKRKKHGLSPTLDYLDVLGVLPEERLCKRTHFIRLFQKIWKKNSVRSCQSRSKGIMYF
ncbi:hypothetical protein P4S93_00915 [Aneurinibacillus thermoaerophilus]|uniref:Uncharacterized protein n=1 Tax=Aneurinibacillus thermoaerophilus TaxID=143495 RepID=A0ABX8Y668_ANETH|nr:MULTISPECIES: hypothetical protein [Aneurinibacillus]MED0676584.1 hypothetical protein [Aneurinibacillus thermoaerophilus]MED0680387.1 hypothetical protein [Aneurinibacillus thermoaerophilus]MED0757127.1 hypothetical protein [Aneurinibacillus thermoaerophilus]MED0759352.1 hypothetical protein [Aneurinibacillus thermoaerophilus]MED0762776.1 hypothetical protein [Aneurinibacillus thermoaerophilus]